MPILRPLRSKVDLDAYMDLCVYCFSMGRDYRSYYSLFVGQHLECTFGAFEYDRLLAAMWYIPYEMNVGGAYIPMGGVAAVATAGHARNRGLAKTLMTRAHRQMKDEGRPLAVLMPFKAEFYARMGYGDVFHYQDCRVRPEALKRPSPKGFAVVPVDPIHEWKTFDRLHTEYGARYFGTVKRTLPYWKLRYFGSQLGIRYHYLIMRGKKPAGYIITHLDKGESAYAPELSRGSEMSIVQAVWTDLDSFNAILSFVHGHRDQFRRIGWRLPIDIPMRQIDEQMDVSIKPKMMLKLVDLKGAVERRPFPADLRGELQIQVKGEDTSPWNDGLWRIRWSDGKARVTKVKSASHAATLKTDIQTLAVIYSGYRPASGLAGVGLVSGSPSAIELLDRAFPQQNCYIDEWF